MGLTQRIALIKKIEELRGSTVMCFLTSVRENVMSVIADDSVRVFFDHLLLLPSKPIAKLDLFLCSNGGAELFRGAWYRCSGNTPRALMY